jgi:hypothetical protein
MKFIRNIFILFITYFILPTSFLANSMTIDIDLNQNLNLSKNSIDLFNEKNITPGSTFESKVKVNNNINSKVIFYLDHFEVVQNSGLLDKIIFSIYQDEKLLFKGKHSDLSNKNLLTFNKFSSKNIKIISIFDENAGNNYQNKSFEIKLHFRVEVLEKAGNNSSFLPQTGESKLIYYSLIGSIIFFSLMILILLFKMKKERTK